MTPHTKAPMRKRLAFLFALVLLAGCGEATVTGVHYICVVEDSTFVPDGGPENCVDPRPEAP